MLPLVVRWARLRGDDDVVERERRDAEIIATEAALRALPRLVEDLGTDRDVADQLRDEYQRRLLVLRAGQRSDGETGGVTDREERYTALRLALLGHKHRTVVRLRDHDEIDDVVLQRIQAKLDLEEVVMTRRHGATPTLPDQQRPEQQ